MLHFFQKQTGTVKVLLGTLFITLIILVAAIIHYGKINRSEDPRVLEARELLLQYEKLLESDEYGTALSMLNGMDTIYAATPGYENSFERGVILNNKATVHLVKLETELLTNEVIDRDYMVESLELSEKDTRAAIHLYKDWLATFGSLQRLQIEELVRPAFPPDDHQLKKVNLENVIQKRVEDIILAQVETKRRLSVSYTNLGMIQRYKGNLAEAKHSYEKAIELWDRNYTAKNNLNVLMDQPVEKRSIIDRMFPPEKAAELNQ